MFKEIFNPDLYHGKWPWLQFEGWYFKVCDAACSLVLIPGIFHGTKTMAPHAFIQVLDGNSCTFEYFTFSAKDFSCNFKNLEIRISDNYFSLEQIRVNLSGKFINLQAQLSLSHQYKWKHNSPSQSSMGYYNYLPFMECYSQVCLMDASACGHITVNSQPITILDASTYVEKNWGKQFPYSWIWVQSNLFSKKGVSITASIAHIPMPLGSFRGFLIGLKLFDKFYEFTTMNGSKIVIDKKEEDVIITSKSKNNTLIIQTFSNPKQFTLLTGPKDGQMKPLVKEALTSTVRITLIDNSTGKIIFEDIGRCAGIEYGGAAMDL